MFRRICSVLLIIMMMNTLIFVPGCGNGDGANPLMPESPPPQDPPTVEYAGSPTMILTDITGKVQIETSMVSNESIVYSLSVVDENSQPLKGMAVYYEEINGTSCIVVRDPAKTHTSALLFGSPEELRSAYGHAPFPETAESRVAVGFVALLVVVVAIAIAQVSFIRHAYRVDYFYLTDYVRSEADYVLYCKGVDEIVDHIVDRVMGAVDLSSIIISFITAAGGPRQGARKAVEVFVEKVAEDYIRDLVIGGISEFTGRVGEDYLDRNIGFRVYFPRASSNGFAKMYAAFEIDVFEEACEQDNETVSGMIRDAETSNPIDGVLARMRGPANRNTSTNHQGEFEFFDLPSGLYTLTATKSGYIDEERQVEVGGAPVIVNLVMSREMQSDEFRIVLTWGTMPRDLDSHLWTGWYHVYFANRGNVSGPPYVQLDVDDRTGEGPETITIGQLTGLCKYAVYNFSGSPSIATSGAEVRVYAGNSLQKTYHVPTSGDGRWWHVCDITSSGSILDRNVLGDNAPGVVPNAQKLTQANAWKLTHLSR